MPCNRPCARKVSACARPWAMPTRRHYWTIRAPGARCWSAWSTANCCCRTPASGVCRFRTRAVAAIIQAAPAFAGDKGFDRALYESQLRRQGLTPAAFEADLAQLAGPAADRVRPCRHGIHVRRPSSISWRRCGSSGATCAWRRSTGRNSRPQAPRTTAAIQAYYDAHKARVHDRRAGARGVPRTEPRRHGESSWPSTTPCSRSATRN